MKSRLIKIILFLALGCLLIPRPFLILTDYPNGNTFLRTVVRPYETFYVQWVHSVEKTPWRETYEVAAWGQGMKLVQSQFQSYGAGVPHEAPGRIRIDNGWVYIDFDEKREKVIYLISRDDYILGVGKNIYRLSDMVLKNSSVCLMIKYLPWCVVLF